MAVIPAKAGIQKLLERLDSGSRIVVRGRLRRNDDMERFRTFYGFINIGITSPCPHLVRMEYRNGRTNRSLDSIHDSQWSNTH